MGKNEKGRKKDDTHTQNPIWKKSKKERKIDCLFNINLLEKIHKSMQFTYIAKSTLIARLVNCGKYLNGNRFRQIVHRHSHEKGDEKKSHISSKFGIEPPNNKTCQFFKMSF